MTCTTTRPYFRPGCKVSYYCLYQILKNRAGLVPPNENLKLLMPEKATYLVWRVEPAYSGVEK